MDAKKIIDKLKEKVRIIHENNDGMNNDIDYIVSKIKRLHTQDMLVPVICEDMYEYEDPITKERQSLHSYVIEEVINNACKNGRNLELTERELTDIVEEGYHGMSILQTKIGNDIYEDLYNSIMDEDNKIRFGVCLKKIVRDFLLVGDFPLIVTTNCFPILEKELGNKHCSYWNELQTKNDTPLPNKCIYHVFGKAKSDISYWGYNDKQVLSFLRSALSDNYSLDNLNTKIANNTSRHTLMILGNDCPDWLFRFILSPIYGGDVYDDGIGYYINDRCKEEERSLEHFLREIKFKKESQLFNVLDGVTKKIIASNESVHGNQKQQYDFFIAHAGEDKDCAQKLVERMRKNGLSVWVDYENIKDGHYWQRIINAMKNSTYFMPYITERYIQKNKKMNEVKEAFRKLSMNDVSLDMAECVKLESYLEGAQIELLLANKWAEITNRDTCSATYSIPVIQKGSTLNFEPITTERLKNWSAESRLLPQSLFWGIQMYEFDENSPDAFSLDWNRYKTAIK